MAIPGTPRRALATAEAFGLAERYLAESIMPSLLPLVEELMPLAEPESVFQRLAGLPHCLFLDSAMQDPVLGRYSFLAADPFDYFECPVGIFDCPADENRTPSPLPPRGSDRARKLPSPAARERQGKKLPSPAAGEGRG